MPGMLKTARKERNTAFLPAITLARWQLRHTWHFLLISGSGIIGAIMLVCAISLYSNVAMSTSLHNTLTSSYENVDINVQSFSEYPDIPVFDTTTQELNAVFQRYLGPYLRPPQFVVEAPDFIIPSGHLTFLGFPMDQVSPHLHLIRGTLPSTSSKKLEIALSSESAARMHVDLGTVITTTVSFGTPLAIPVNLPLQLQVVGIFKPVDANDPFWHGNTFLSSSAADGVYYSALTSNEAFLSAITRLSSQPAVRRKLLVDLFILHWYYQLDPSHITINNLNALSKNIDLAQAYVSDNEAALEQGSALEKMVSPPNDTLDRYRNRASVVLLSTTALLVMVVGLALFYVTTIVSLLVVRRAGAIALLSSRGASTLQIFGSLLLQSIGVAILAIVVGPILAIGLASVLVRSTLGTVGQQNLGLITGNREDLFAIVGGYALLTGLAAIGVLALSFYRAGRMNVVAYRRETARPTARPLWQRYYLDVIAILLAFLGALFALYLEKSGLLDAHLRLLLLTPLALSTWICLLLAGTLLLLRLFPPLMQASERAAASGRGVTPLLALAQISRAPQPYMRQVLLLSLTIAFMIFTLTFFASQAQRANDVATYQAGADFQGTLTDTSISASDLNAETTLYRRLPGVDAATVGFVGTVTATGQGIIPLTMQAVDASTFAQTAIWPQHQSSLFPLMRLLSTQRTVAIRKGMVPAIVNAAMATQLRLSPGKPFLLTLPLTGETMNFLTVAEVSLIPPVLQSGVLVDYSTFATVYANNTPSTGSTPIAPNTVWLRTTDNPAVLRSLRHTLSESLSPLIDRRALSESLQNDPLTLDLMVTLILGMSTSLLVAWSGTVFNFWISIVERLRKFVVLRALGAQSQHVISIIIWEQGFVYAAALSLGILFGMFLSVQVIPSMIITTVLPDGATGSLSSQDFYLLQTTPPVQLVVPSMIGIALAGLIALCGIALVILTVMLLRPSGNATLRINED